MKARLPVNEEARLAALCEFGVLDSPREAAYDDVTALAAQLCDAPISAISLVDANRQWFKATVGLETRETARDVAFCAHAILEPELMIVPDAMADPRFSDNPLVTGSPNIRFYAGAQLVTSDGHVLGTLCVIDRKPRMLSSDQVMALRALSRAVMTQLELRRQVAHQAEKHRRN